jgi:hypothetical protein
LGFQGKLWVYVWLFYVDALSMSDNGVHCNLMVVYVLFSKEKFVPVIIWACFTLIWFPWARKPDQPLFNHGYRSILKFEIDDPPSRAIANFVLRDIGGFLSLP